MAKIMTEPKTMPKTLRHQMPDFDYSKYENTKVINSRRKEIRAAANGEREDKISTNPKKAFRIDRDEDAPRVPVIHGSVGKLDQHEKIKLAQFRNTKTEIKARARGQDLERPRAKSSQERRSHARSPASSSRVSPIQEVRRKLQFDESDVDTFEVPKPGEIDFTDKMAALRALINKDRETKNIHDRKAYYDEYKTSNRKIIVSRNDSLKENHRNGYDVEALANDDLDRLNKGERGKVRDSHRNVQSADIFREKMKNDRMSVADLELLKNNLMNKNKSGRRSADILNNSNDVINQQVDSGDAMFHATEGRKIMVSSRGQRRDSLDNGKNGELLESKQNSRSGSSENSRRGSSEGKRIMVSSRGHMPASADRRGKDEDEMESRPSSRNDAKETQTSSSFLNNSFRSVQSNVPFYEPGGTPLRSTPVIRETRKRLDSVQGNVPEGIEPGVNVGTREAQSPGRSGRLQTNVEPFVGQSLTPEKEKRKSASVCNGVKDMDAGRSSGPKRSKKEDKLFNEVKKLSEQWSIRNEGGSKRILPKFRSSSRAENVIDNDVLSRGDNDVNQRKAKERFRSKSSLDYNKDDFLDQEFSKRILEKTNKTDRKVREWIEKQKIINKDDLADDRDMLIEEFSVDVCISSRTPNHDTAPSPTHSCDKIPVKLEKPQKFRPASAPVFNKKAGSRLQTTEGRVPSRNSINARLDQISNAALSEQNRLELEFPVRDIQGRVRGRHREENDSTESE